MPLAAFRFKVVKRPSLTKIGFLALQRVFIIQGRLETVWTILRKYGYSTTLPVLREEYLHPRWGVHFPFCFSLGDIPEGSSCELTPAGYHFILSLFNRHSRNNDGSITWNDLESLFSLVPNGNPWIGTGFPHGTSINEKGELALHGYLTQWSYVCVFILE